MGANLTALEAFSPRTRGCSFRIGGFDELGGVFPAYAGMFLRVAAEQLTPRRFPRIRGDVPNPEVLPAILAWVFPAYAGMFRRPDPRGNVCRGFPRIRGDVPGGLIVREYLVKFSPHTRGCSSFNPLNTKSTKVFPAYAGMFPSHQQIALTRQRFPRIRGDVPGHNVAVYFNPAFSPHTRGCSEGETVTIYGDDVFPAYTGMFRRQRRNGWRPRRFPRVCGDVPARLVQRFKRFRFSPRMRGCSWLENPPDGISIVFPAYAGMFPPKGSRIGLSCSFPRVCGDVPAANRAAAEIVVFSPHTRGCSALAGGYP